MGQYILKGCLKHNHSGYNFEYYIDKGFYWSIGLKSRYNTFHKNVNASLFLDEGELDIVGLKKADIRLTDQTNQFFVQTLFRKDFSLKLGAEHKRLKISSETFVDESEGESEKTTFENVVNARNAAMAVPSDDINGQIKAENQLQQTLRSIFALSEAYPDLKANTNYLDLQQKLNEIEENLERSRRYYNGTVRENNTYGESLPGTLFAGMFNYQHFDFFETDEASRENVKVKF